MREVKDGSKVSDLSNFKGWSSYLLRRWRFQEKQVWEEEDQEFGFGRMTFKILAKPPGGDVEKELNT